MVETYLVSHCGRFKFIREKSKALEHAYALEKLGYPVAVYYVVRTLYHDYPFLIYRSSIEQAANAYAQVGKFETKE